MTDEESEKLATSSLETLETTKTMRSLVGQMLAGGEELTPDELHHLAEAAETAQRIERKAWLDIIRAAKQLAAKPDSAVQ